MFVRHKNRRPQPISPVLILSSWFASGMVWVMLIGHLVIPGGRLSAEQWTGVGLLLSAVLLWLGLACAMLLRRRAIFVKRRP
ncbi:MAG: hypothetical protein M0Z53_15815 [Thermaerobacter sp.]|nr:hypothetical protein [Thermaerobacter sp.]